MSPRVFTYEGLELVESGEYRSPRHGEYFIKKTFGTEKENPDQSVMREWPEDEKRRILIPKKEKAMTQTRIVHMAFDENMNNPRIMSEAEYQKAIEKPKEPEVKVWDWLIHTRKGRFDHIHKYEGGILSRSEGHFDYKIITNPTLIALLEGEYNDN